MYHLHNKYMNEKPIVSISCLAYNHEEFIVECLNGFLMQETNFAYEVLIHDDASTDNTANIIRKYEAEHPEIIKPIYQTENQYSKSIGSIGLKYNFPRAKGKYIAICEGDDYWTDPLKLQRQVDFLETHDDFSLCAHSVNTIFDKSWNTEKTNRFLKPIRVAQFEDVIDYHYLPSNSLLFRSNVVANLPNWVFINKNLIASDVLICLMNASHGKVYYMENPMATKRINGGGITADIVGRRNRMISYKLVLYAITNRYSKGKYRKTLLPKQFKQYLRLVKKSIISGEIKNVFTFIKYISPPYL